MGRSLYGMLHRRYGRRTTGAERSRHAREFRDRLHAALPMELLDRPAASGGSATVAVIGAGFAGCVAASTLARGGWQVTVYDSTGTAGGRVSSSSTVVPGRIIEAGAELIGINHPLWVSLAQQYGFALGVVTPDDDYAGAGLLEPLWLNGVSYDDAASTALYDGMTKVFTRWVASAVAEVPDPYAPWNAFNAGVMDSHSLGQHIPHGTPAEVAYATGLEFELNNTVPIGAQSWLANLAQFQAGQAGDPIKDGLGFFDDTEVYRSTAGNQALAWALLGGIPVVPARVTSIDTSGGVTIGFEDGQTASFDYVVVATSVERWQRITVDGNPFPYPPVQFGPAIKYLAPVDQRFWIGNGTAPSAMSDALGMTWEGTDNQADTAGFELTVFAGGTLARNAIEADGTDAYFAPLIQTVYPGFSTPGGTFASHGYGVLRGYSCPAPGQVTGAQQSYATPYNNCLVLAGEHVSPAWFGFMEGALESGLVAAAQLLNGL
jgi:monoamine oxidase